MDIWWATGGIVATILALCFWQSPPKVHTRTKWQRSVVEQGHAAAWALVALGLGLAALVGSWTSYSQLLCLAGVATYAMFVGVLVPSVVATRAVARSAATTSTISSTKPRKRGSRL